MDTPTPLFRVETQKRMHKNMMKHDSIWVEKPNDLNEYGLRIDRVDVDGIKMVETHELKEIAGVYIYYSELPTLIPILQEIYNEHKKSI